MSVISDSSRKWWVLGGVSIASFLGCIDFTIVNTALPAIQTTFQCTVNQLQWIINIFILALSTCMVIMGRLADMYGRRLVLYIGMITFGLASLAAGLTDNIFQLIVCRLVQGMASAILYTATGAIVSQAFPPKEKGKAIGALFGVNGIGLAIGPVLGGMIVSLLNWRWIFFINVPFIILSLIICGLSVHESKDENSNKKIDWLGLGTLITALPLLIFGIIQASQNGFMASTTVMCLGISTLLFCLFYFIENKVATPIIEFKLFSSRNFIISIVATFALAFFYCLAFFVMPLYLHSIKNEYGLMIGIMLLPTTAMVAILSPIVGRIVDKIGVKLMLAVGFACFFLSAWMQMAFQVDTSTFYIIIAFTLMGIGWACILGPSTVAALAAIPEKMSAVAIGTSWTLHNVGGAIGLAIGMVFYRAKAQAVLLQNLTDLHFSGGAWVKDIISNPETALSQLQQQLGLSPKITLNLFQHFFISGYHAAMALLMCSSLLAFCIISLGMKEK